MTTPDITYRLEPMGPHWFSVDVWIEGRGHCRMALIRGRREANEAGRRIVREMREAVAEVAS